jgi:hypothetical protein
MWSGGRTNSRSKLASRRAKTMKSTTKLKETCKRRGTQKTTKAPARAIELRPLQNKQPIRITRLI